MTGPSCCLDAQLAGPRYIAWKWAGACHNSANTDSGNREGCSLQEPSLWLLGCLTLACAAVTALKLTIDCPPDDAYHQRTGWEYERTSGTREHTVGGTESPGTLFAGCSDDLWLETGRLAYALRYSHLSAFQADELLFPRATSKFLPACPTDCGYFKK